MRLRSLLPLLVLASGLSAADVARADLMTTCAPEIGKYCSGISQGRGRVSACLAAYTEQISAACRAEVSSVMSGRLVPGNVRKVVNPGFRSALPAACTADASRFCSGIPQGDGRAFLCLYANSNRVSATCTSAAEATVKAR
jgi:hypothetical protein